MDLGEEIRGAREARGWDQAMLARVMGVSQQTVSRWERGKTTPAGPTIDRVRAALGMTEERALARRPLLDELPFNAALADEYQFESFSEALASDNFPAGSEVIRYGVRGDKQHGIDVRVITPAGERIGIQCKRYVKFQVNAFTKAVEEFDKKAAGVDRCILFLSCKASAQLIEECDKHSDWTIWDSRTLSRKVRELPDERALALTDRYFPGMREEFLGIHLPSVWSTAAELLPGTASPVYSHEFDLVGHRAMLDEMLEFATAEEVVGPVAVLSGMAGTGKSRLLLELAREHDALPRSSTRVLSVGPVEPEVFEQLPRDGRLLVLIDDAHERVEDLGWVVAGVLRERPHARVVIATRPYGRPVVQSALRVAGVEERTVPRWDVAPLSTDEAHALADQVLGAEKSAAASFLAQVAADCPLLLISTAIAVERGDLDPAELFVDEDVHRLLLDVFVRSALSRSPEQDGDRALLHALAALQPVKVDVPHFQEALSELLGVPFARIGPQLRRLEETGILVRRGASVRIVPDLLGDALLTEAAVDTHLGSRTDYPRRIRTVAAGEAFTHALINASRVDWRRDERSRYGGRVIDPLWEVIESDFKTGNSNGRLGLMDLLRAIAPFQPDRVMNLIRWVVDQPPGPEASRVPHWMSESWSHAEVLRKVPNVLESVATDLDQLRGVCDLLWHLGQHDTRPLHQFPDAPLRILTELASYVPGRPVEHYKILLDAVQDWLEEEPPNPADRMPLALLGPIFSATAESRTLKDWTLTIGTHPVNVDIVAPLRERAISILMEQYTSADPVRAVTAARTFQDVLRTQHGEFQELVLEFLRRLAETTGNVPPEPMVALAVRESLDWTATHGAPRLRSASREVLDALPDSTDHRLALLIHIGPYSELLRQPKDHENPSTEWLELRQVTLTELALRPPKQLAANLVAFVESGRKTGAGNAEGMPSLIGDLVREVPNLPVNLVSGLRKTDDVTVQNILPYLLYAWLDKDTADAMRVCRTMVEEGRREHIISILRTLRTRVTDTSLRETGALELIQELATHPDDTIRAGVIDFAAGLAGVSPDLAVNLAISTPTKNVGRSLDRLCWALAQNDRLLWRRITNEQRNFFREELRKIPSFEGYGLQVFFSCMVEHDAHDSLKLLCERVERSRGAGLDDHYDALPNQWHVKLPWLANSTRPELLRFLYSWTMQTQEDAWHRGRCASKLFWNIAGSADKEILEFLINPYISHQEDLAHAISPILSGIPKSVIWDRPDFVGDLLRSASQISTEILRKVERNLFSAAFDGPRQGAMGEPYAEDIEIFKKSRQVRAGLSRGSKVDLFYKALKDSAGTAIERSRREDIDDL